MSIRRVVLFLVSLPLSAQWFSVGAKGGLPLTATSDSARENSRYGGDTHFQLKRYTVGPSVEIGLPWHLSVEAAGLYKRARQDRFAGPAPSGSLLQQGTRAGIWEIPLLLKYRWPDHHPVAPFVSAGSTIRRVGDLEVDLITIPTFPGYPGTRSRLSIDSGEPLRYGATFGGGISWKLGMLRLEPEVRYTHWTSKHWMATQEQVEFLLGVAFPFGKSGDHVP